MRTAYAGTAMKIVKLPQQNFEEFSAHPCGIHGLKMLDIVLGIEHETMELSGVLLQKVRESIDDLIRLVREECRIENSSFHILHSEML